MTYIPDAEKIANKNSSNGFPGLDGNGQISLSQLQQYGPAGPGHKAGIVPGPGEPIVMSRYMADNNQWLYPICAVRDRFEFVDRSAVIDVTDSVNDTVNGTGLFRCSFYASIKVAGAQAGVNLIVSFSWIDHSNTVQTLNYNLAVNGVGGKISDLFAFRLRVNSKLTFWTSFDGTALPVVYYLQIAVDKAEQL